MLAHEEPPPAPPLVFGQNLQGQPVRGVNTQEECHWSHACKSFKRAGMGNNGTIECKFLSKTRTVPFVMFFHLKCPGAGGGGGGGGVGGGGGGEGVVPNTINQPRAAAVVTFLTRPPSTANVVAPWKPLMPGASTCTTADNPSAIQSTSSSQATVSFAQPSVLCEGVYGNTVRKKRDTVQYLYTSGSIYICSTGMLLFQNRHVSSQPGTEENLILSLVGILEPEMWSQ
jgi:hypothetical protein